MTMRSREVSENSELVSQVYFQSRRCSIDAQIPTVLSEEVEEDNHDKNNETEPKVQETVV